MNDRIKLYQGDCLEIMELIPDNSIDMILCDLPYGITKCKWDIIVPLESLWKQYERVIKNNGPIILTASQPFTSMLVTSNLKIFRYDLIWIKTTPTGHLNANRMPLRAHEDILVFYKNLPVYNPHKSTGHVRKVSSAYHKRDSKKSINYGEHGLTSYDSTERYPKSIFVFATDKQKLALHPTQKPVMLMEYLIKTYTNENDLVLDNCMGSGTTGIACINTGRRFIGIEKDEKYFVIAKNRIKNHDSDVS